MAASACTQWICCLATHSRLRRMIDKAKMLKSCLIDILTYHAYPIMNATSERMNSKIQCVKYTALGFRACANFASAIYFRYGGLDLAPHALKKRTALIQ
jgi:transposase